jgi:hypothetical protein
MQERCIGRGLHPVPRYRFTVEWTARHHAPHRLIEEPAMPFDVPDACALPTAEQPLRLAEFDTLFATAVRQVETVSPTHARMRMSGPAGLEATVRDLTARETECCSFFAFTTAPSPQADDGEALTLDIEVPGPYAGVLASLVQQAKDRSGIAPPNQPAA